MIYENTKSIKAQIDRHNDEWEKYRFDGIHKQKKYCRFGLSSRRSPMISKLGILKKSVVIYILAIHISWNGPVSYNKFRQRLEMPF